MSDTAYLIQSHEEKMAGWYILTTDTIRAGRPPEPVFVQLLPTDKSDPIFPEQLASSAWTVAKTKDVADILN